MVSGSVAAWLAAFLSALTLAVVIGFQIRNETLARRREAESDRLADLRIRQSEARMLARELAEHDQALRGYLVVAESVQDVFADCVAKGRKLHPELPFMGASPASNIQEVRTALDNLTPDPRFDAGTRIALSELRAVCDPSPWAGGRLNSNEWNRLSTQQLERAGAVTAAIRKRFRAEGDGPASEVA
jgi:hypothetical protein